jgi:hypothetical protein
MKIYTITIRQTSACKVNGILVPMRKPYNLEQDVQTSVGAPYVSM